METLVLLLTALLGLRVVGALGVARFAVWSTCGAYALALMLIVTGTTHFVPASFADTPVPTHADLVAMVPPWVPFPALMVYLTGVLELAGAVGLVLGRTRRWAGLGLAVLFVLLIPANIYAALAEIPFHGAPATPLWVRIPEQVLYIAVALLASRSVAERKVEKDRTATESVAHSRPQ
ncbi:DoxX family protein [Nocardia suismassiliense]|uniref:DoxX family protein n=1 Tax=Nocardia suismassiliense TaxID=2077092 RepID=UPI000D1ED716|nr:DoxX family membrane protein [Nocardia suismassiliense]